ncbi:MAG: hypothetical protein IT495_17005 [Gammaproteobacteria bacterium]|nr:hypothetical protein [Gammaproteobacteria bacterium]
MSLLTRKRALLAKIESSYGADATPTGAADAVLLRSLQVTPIASEIVGRDLIRAYLGHSAQIPVAVHAMLECEVELAGSGTAGQAPAWGPLLRACGFAQTALASAHTGTAQAGASSSITLAAGASASNDAYKHMSIRTTGGTGSGQRRVIQSYDGTTKVATVTEAWTTPPDATTDYSIDAQVVYAPVSTGFESLTLYLNADGVRHRMLGARGSVALSLTRGALPVLRFRFMGVYVAVADAALPTVTLTAWQQPVPVDNVHTTGLRLHGLATAVLAQFELDVANALTFRSLPGGTEQVLLTDRRPAGSAQIEATTVADKDWWTNITNATTGALALTQGTVAGNIVRVDAPAIELIEPRYDDLDGVQMLAANTVCVPVAGDDELVLSAA